MSVDFDLATVLVPTGTGEIISEKQRRIAQIITDFDPELELRWIPLSKRVYLDDPPFCVTHTPVGKPSYVVLYAEDCDERLLARLFQARNTSLDLLTAHNNAVKAVQLKKRMETFAEAEDKALHVLRSPKSSYSIDGKIIQSHGPVLNMPKPKVIA